ncbi:hypothetical protein AFCA_012450 [Aspergillus flavus]|nr:hypothetical protein AFCA_012450 [Aspergillus flavus]
MDDAHLNSTQYNWLSSIFYFGYLLAEWPQNWALQRFPVAKWLAINLVVWGGITLLHIPCNSFATLFVVRFFLGVAEASIVPAFLLILSMFFTYQEQAVLMPIMWSIGNASPITSGLLSYGVLWIKTGTFAPWKWFMVITGGVTVVFGLAVWLFFPDNPLRASFLTPEERAQAILRIKDNHSGIEQKHFKKYQYKVRLAQELTIARFIEAVKDPKSWLFFLHAWSQEMANGMTNQYSLIINSFGFTVLQTTLLGCVTGIVSFFSLASAAVVLAKTTVACILPSLVIVYLRWYLSKENKRRDLLQSETFVTDTGVVEEVDNDGTKHARLVDKNQLDLTDRENVSLYVLCSSNPFYLPLTVGLLLVDMSFNVEIHFGVEYRHLFLKTIHISLFVPEVSYDIYLA